jgi:lysozyme family protein
VETSEGRAEFVAFQKKWTERTQRLRSRFLAAVDTLEDLASPVGDLVT